MQNRLNDLAADGNPWRFSARELLGLAAQKAGKTRRGAHAVQRLLGDRDTPPGIGERARVMMAMLTEAELAKSPAPAAPSPPAEKTPASGDKPKAEEEIEVIRATHAIGASMSGSAAGIAATARCGRRGAPVRAVAGRLRRHVSPA